MIDWSKADADLVSEIVERGETYLQAQLTVATSADQRAASMASIFAASGAAIVAGLIAAVATDTTRELFPVFAGGVVGAALFLVGATLCTLAILPVGFFLPGTQPSNWEMDIASGKDVKTALAELAGNYQSKIDGNRVTIEKNAHKFTWGATAGVVAPIAGFIVWLATSFCHP